VSSVAAAPPAPPAAAVAFGERLPLAERYAELLAGPGVERGLIGPREVPRIWTRHLLNCVVLADHIPRHARVLDVGSGAGLPGIPVALARPDLTVTLLDSMLRRTTFLEEAVSLLGLPATVLRCRAEQALVGSADVVVARAVAPLPRLLSLTLPLLAPGGRLLALKGKSAAAEIAEARAVLKQWPGAAISHSTTRAGGDDTVIVQVTTGTGKGLRE
jgi:16S rRNA (guanine527-N7)-methyltransferase